jgi:hypothetical protein
MPMSPILLKKDRIPMALIFLFRKTPDNPWRKYRIIAKSVSG